MRWQSHQGENICDSTVSLVACWPIFWPVFDLQICSWTANPIATWTASRSWKQNLLFRHQESGCCCCISVHLPGTFVEPWKESPTAARKCVGLLKQDSLARLPTASETDLHSNAVCSVEARYCHHFPNELTNWSTTQCSGTWVFTRLRSSLCLSLLCNSHLPIQSLVSDTPMFIIEPTLPTLAPNTYIVMVLKAKVGGVGYVIHFPVVRAMPQMQPVLQVLCHKPCGKTIHFN